MTEELENYTHYITDVLGNEWKVIEVSDLQEIIDEQVKKEVRGLLEQMKGVNPEYHSEILEDYLDDSPI